MKEVWRKSLGELERVRRVDLMMIGTHFEEAYLLQKEYGYLSSQMVNLRARYHALELAKDQSEREVAKSLAEGQMLLVVVSRYHADYKKSFDYTKANLAKDQKENERRHGAACLLENQLREERKDNMLLLDLLRVHKEERSAKYREVNALEKTNKKIWVNIQRIEKQCDDTEAELSAYNTAIENLTSTQSATNQHIDGTSEINHRLQNQIQAWTEKENLTCIRISKLAAINREFSEKLKYQQEKLENTKALLANQKKVYENEQVKSAELNSNIAIAQERLADRRLQLSNVKEEIRVYYSSNTTGDRRNRHLVHLLAAYNRHLLELSSSAGQLISAANDSLGQDITVRSLLFKKQESFRALQLRHKELIEHDNCDTKNSPNNKLNASRSTHFSNSSSWVSETSHIRTAD